VVNQIAITIRYQADPEYLQVAVELAGRVLADHTELVQSLVLIPDSSQQLSVSFDDSPAYTVGDIGELAVDEVIELFRAAAKT
jgi:hypothetical protein